ncbi:Raf kinase inhibitor-like YbhB/YbcL family protein [Novosphingobium chloroacetimidivorans]|uniref:Raf kinase inhibitor-like YbhB/YbcL family protein n=1 Tax=Novosphingobium chloroacetimidivorans TaxID=1428314 RepID=A0A7W7K6S7_9SPHN|nr:YbhB/YbcL family Raf kinase inhibitor-like protein [Novosphingobium chloroacetimidivorans]MBB4856965.1 Raf kinase inhibitor-like YbhB/YbcL family protein [Novosphingobium chloroacetimidivorans]
MLEHVPHWLGAMLTNVRAGHAKLAIVQDGVASGVERIDLSSPAFADGARLPERFTADGIGISPPLVWGEVPAGTTSLALLVEDPDAPAPNPLVHALVWNLPSDERRLEEGEIAQDGDGELDGRDVGRNSYLAEGWLPPDPPTGHGNHDYVFQLFALRSTPDLGSNPGRSRVAEALQGNVLAAGLLVGTYSRGETSPLQDGTDAFGTGPALA